MLAHVLLSAVKWFVLTREKLKNIEEWKEENSLQSQYSETEVLGSAFVYAFINFDTFTFLPYDVAPFMFKFLWGI